MLTIAPAPCWTITVSAARDDRRFVKKFIEQRPLEVLVGQREEPVQPQSDAADVVHEHVDPTEVDDCSIHETGGPRRRGQVDRDRRDAGEPSEAVDRERPGDDVGTLVAEGLGDGEADAPSGTGDDRDLLLEQQIHAEWFPSIEGCDQGRATESGDRIQDGA